MLAVIVTKKNQKIGERLGVGLSGADFGADRGENRGMRPDLYRRGVADGGRLPPGAVVPWGNGFVFDCPCGGRTVYVSTSREDHGGGDPHVVEFDAAGLATIKGSLGYREKSNLRRPMNWCHFWITGGEFGMYGDALCPGRLLGRVEKIGGLGVSTVAPIAMRARWPADEASLYDLGPGWFEWRERDALWILHAMLPVDPDALRAHGWESTPPSKLSASIPCTTDAALAAATEHLWHWNGSALRPTLTPSVDLKVGRPGADVAELSVWHGWITDGELRRC